MTYPTLTDDRMVIGESMTLMVISVTIPCHIIYDIEGMLTTLMLIIGIEPNSNMYYHCNPSNLTSWVSHPFYCNLFIT
jgi:hypothetical protein